MPNVYVIAGPNGAGKTTFSREFLPHYVHCREFLNADLMAAGLAPFDPDAAAMRAGRLLLERIKELAQQGRDFGFETTLAGKSYARMLRRMRARGYAVHLFFLWLPNVEIALARIAHRVSQGGHDVPEPVVRRRFAVGVRNLLQLYRPLVDYWALFDNSRTTPEPIAVEEQGQLTIFDQRPFNAILMALKEPPA